MRRTTRLAAETLIGVGLAVMIATTASAQGRPGPRGPGRGGPPDPGEMMQRLDKNDDGKLTKDEVPEQLWARLSQADADDDGAVTKEEFSKMARERFARAPFGGLGPMRGGPAAGGGPPRRGRPGAGPGPGPARRPEAPAERKKRGEAEESEKATTDKEGDKPRRGEPRAKRPDRADVADRVFARIDKDGDGSISKEEFRQSMASRAAYARRARGAGPMWGRAGQGPGRPGQMRRPGSPPWGRPGFGFGQPGQGPRGLHGGGPPRAGRGGLQHRPWPGRGFAAHGAFGRPGRPAPAWQGPPRRPHRGPAAGRGGHAPGRRGPGPFRFGAIQQDDVLSDSERQLESPAIVETDVAAETQATDSQQRIATATE